MKLIITLALAATFALAGCAHRPPASLGHSGWRTDADRDEHWGDNTVTPSLWDA